MRFFSFKNKIVSAMAIALLLLLLPSCGLFNDNASEPVTKTELAMDTLCSITLYGTSGKTADEAVFEACFHKIRDIEEKMSAHMDTSEVSEINRNAGIRPVRVSEDTWRVVSAGKNFSEMTSGRFDITVGPLVRLWGISGADPKVPPENAVRQAAALVDYRKVVLDDAERTVFLTEKGMSLDLGGIAKGYAGDAAAEILKEKGVRHATVDLGGNLVTIGTKPGGTDWNVGIQTPFQPNGDYFAVLRVADKAVVTSGIYQRYFKEKEKNYHHIMDVKTGYPVDNGLVSVTAVCESSMDADALAKALTLGLEGGMRFIENQEGVNAIFVTDDNEVYITPGIRDFFRITDDTFHLMNDGFQ